MNRIVLSNFLKKNDIQIPKDLIEVCVKFIQINDAFNPYFLTKIFRAIIFGDTMNTKIISMRFLDHKLYIPFKLKIKHDYQWKIEISYKCYFILRLGVKNLNNKRKTFCTCLSGDYQGNLIVIMQISIKSQVLIVSFDENKYTRPLRSHCYNDIYQGFLEVKDCYSSEPSIVRMITD